MRVLGMWLVWAGSTWAAVDFSKDVQPILRARCAACHTDSAMQSGFSVATADTVRTGGKKHGRAIVGGYPETSPLIQMIRGTLTPRMPLGAELPAAEIATLEAWIKEMPAEKASAKSTWRWPYEQPVKPPVPAGPAHPVDAFILAKLQTKELTIAPTADRRTLARRVYLDLIGLPPSPEELQAFLSDRAADAYPKLIDRLLADPRYGEQIGRAHV